MGPILQRLVSKAPPPNQPELKFSYFFLCLIHLDFAICKSRNWEKINTDHMDGYEGLKEMSLLVENNLYGFSMRKAIWIWYFDQIWPDLDLKFVMFFIITVLKASKKSLNRWLINFRWWSWRLITKLINWINQGLIMHKKWVTENFVTGKKKPNV